MERIDMDCNVMHSRYIHVYVSVYNTNTYLTDNISQIISCKNKQMTSCGKYLQIDSFLPQVIKERKMQNNF